jgi:uncharacterized protein (DUF169 family)
MPGLKEVEQMLNTFIRPSTFPVAIKMLSSEDEMPERTRRPFQQIKKKVAICQGIGMSRKLGWTIGMGKEDMQCALGAAPFGFFKNIDFFNEGNMAVDMFTVSKELGKTEEDLVDRFDYGVYSHILVAPLSRAAFDPDVLLIYGNPAGAIQSSSTGRLGCAAIITVMKNDQCRFLVPGNGDRIFGMTQDHEMSFMIRRSGKRKENCKWKHILADKGLPQPLKRPLQTRKSRLTELPPIPLWVSAMPSLSAPASRSFCWIPKFL